MRTLVRGKVIVLQRRPWKESDWMVHALSVEGECLHLIAKGGRKSIRRFGGGTLEPTHYIEVCYEDRSSSSGENRWHLLTEAKLLQEFAGLRKDYDRLETALHLVGLVYRVSRESSPEGKELFDLLGNSLKACEACGNLRMLRLQFELKLLYLLGVLPIHDSYRELLEKPIHQGDSIFLESAELRELLLQSDMRLDQYCRGLTV